MGPLSVQDPEELAHLTDLLEDVSLSGPRDDDWTVVAGRSQVAGTGEVPTALQTPGTALREKVKLPDDVKILSQKEVTVQEICPDIFTGKGQVDPFLPHARHRKPLSKEDILTHGEVDFWSMIPENIQKIILEDRREEMKRRIDADAQEAVVLGGENPRKAKMRARLQKKLAGKT